MVGQATIQHFEVSQGAKLGCRDGTSGWGQSPPNPFSFI